MLSFLKKLFGSRQTSSQVSTIKTEGNQKMNVAPIRIGALGEYKINIQLDQLSKDFIHIHDVMLTNPKAKSGFSQIDHLLFTPWAIFVIETKNYSGTIRGQIEEKYWIVNGKFKMMNPFRQNYGHLKSVKLILDVKDMESFVSIVSFTKRATFRVEEELRKIQSNSLCVYDIELTDYILRKINIIKMMNKEPRFSVKDIQEMQQLITSANITNATLRDQHISSNNSDEAVCVTCEKKVSHKVKQYCLSNKKFAGQVFCYEHQKLL